MPIEPDLIDAVIFDMDGVLIDTEKLYRQASFEAAEALGFVMTDEIHRQTVGLPGDVAERLVAERLGPDFPYVEFDARWRTHLQNTLAGGVPHKPGAADLLIGLVESRMPIAVATSTDRDAAHRHLEKAGLRHHFEVIVTRDDVINAKPAPDPYLLAAERLGVPPRRCLAIEDSHNGVRAAHAAGMQTVMVPDLLPPTPEIEALCVAVLAELGEVDAALARWTARGCD